MYICSMVVHIISINKSIKSIRFLQPICRNIRTANVRRDSDCGKDSTFMTVQFYAAAAASLAKDSRLAIAALERAKILLIVNMMFISIFATNTERQELLRILLCWKNIRRRHAGFPDSAFFLNNLINTYIYSNRNEKHWKC